MPQHCDPSDLDRVALGTLQLTADQRAHVDACDACSTTLRALTEVVSTARSAADLELVEPPASVWAAISDQVATGAGATGPADDVVRPLRPTRSPTRWTALGLAAAVGAVLGGIAIGVVTRGSDTGPAGQVVASAQLSPLPDDTGSAAHGSATVKRVDGHDALVVSTTGLPTTDGFYEVWLLDPTTAGLISIGSVAYGDQSTTLPLPDGVRLDQFAVVDISDEPLDGDPTHSTVTVLRGILEA